MEASNPRALHLSTPEKLAGCPSTIAHMYVHDRGIISFFWVVSLKQFTTQSVCEPYTRRT